MHRFLFALSLILLLATACIPGDYYSADPDMAVIEAQANLQKATVIAARTQEAAIEATRVAELDLAQRNEAAEKELAVIEARAQERLEAVNLQMTEQAIWSIQATATAAPMATQQAWMITQPAFEATQQSIARQARDAEAKSRAIQVIYDFGPIVLGAVVVVMAVAMGVGFLYYLYWQDRKNSVIRTPTGLLYFSREGVKLLPAGDSRSHETEPESEIVDYQQLPAVDIRPGRSYAQFDIAPVAVKPDERTKAIKLLDDAIEVNGEDSRQIPSWRKFKDRGFEWNSEDWQKVKGWLEQKGLVESNGGGTFVVDYPSLQNLYFALVTKKI